MQVLMSRAGKVVTKEQLAEKLCAWDEEVGDNAIEVYVHRLRKKLIAADVVIRTIRRLGCLLEKKRMHRAFSLRRQLLVWLLVPIVILCFIWAVMAYAIALRYTNIANDRSLFDSTLTLAGQVKIVGGKVTVDLPRVALNMLELDPYDKIFYEIREPDEELVSGEEGLPRPTLANSDGVPGVLIEVRFKSRP